MSQSPAFRPTSELWVLLRLDHPTLKADPDALYGAAAMPAGLITSGAQFFQRVHEYPEFFEPRVPELGFHEAHLPAFAISRVGVVLCDADTKKRVAIGYRGLPDAKRRTLALDFLLGESRSNVSAECEVALSAVRQALASGGRLRDSGAHLDGDGTDTPGILGQFRGTPYEARAVALALALARVPVCRAERDALASKLWDGDPRGEVDQLLQTGRAILAQPRIARALSKQPLPDDGAAAMEISL